MWPTPAPCRQAVKAAATALGGLDGVVNAAGHFSPAGLATPRPDLFTPDAGGQPDWHVPGRAGGRADPAGIGYRGATIVNIGSGVGMTPTGPGSTAYVASKGGVIAMTKALAMELAPQSGQRGVPGRGGNADDAGFPAKCRRRGRSRAGARYALRRPAEPEEIAAAILFLTSAESSFVTGIAMPVDGGRTFH